jgi:hypothetical protein
MNLDFKTSKCNLCFFERDLIDFKVKGEENRWEDVCRWCSPFVPILRKLCQQVDRGELAEADFLAKRQIIFERIGRKI